MDYLDSKKQLTHHIIIMVGYVLVAIGVTIATLILVELAYGFGLGKNGTVIQNGLIFISSQPAPATIRLNGAVQSAKTNTRLALPEGIYSAQLSRSGYRNWVRTINVQGGSVEHFDYPFLFPLKLSPAPLKTYSTAPGLVTQSPDRRWLIVQQPGSEVSFDVIDLKNPAIVTTTITLPAAILSKATTSESWQLAEWADDNQHLLLRHIYDGKTEYILVDRASPDLSLNLNTTLSTTPTKITLNNRKYDQYYVYDAASGTVQTATLSNPALTPLLSHVLAYQSYATDTILYVTGADAPSGKVLVKLAVGSQTYLIHTLLTSPTYLVDLTEYNGVLYVAAGASSENKVYIYADPIGQLNARPTYAVSPTQVLHVENPNYLSFSDNAQFIVTENATQFGVYDIQNRLGYNYLTSHLPLDAAQTHATWMDGDRLTYISDGKIVVFDYDGTNPQVLSAESPAYVPFFSTDYKYVYGLTPATDPAAAGQTVLDRTALRIPADL